MYLFQYPIYNMSQHSSEPQPKRRKTNGSSTCVTEKPSSSSFKKIFSLKTPVEKGESICSSFNPFKLGEFSLNKERVYRDSVGIPYLKSDVHLPIDLNAGFENRSADSDIPSLDSLFTWVCRNKMSLRSIDLVTYRGLLKKIAVTTADHYKNHWCMRLTKVNSTVFMDEIETQQSRCNKQYESEQQKRFQYYGRKFEQEVLETNTDQEDNETDIVVTAKIGKIRCLVAAEVDGMDSNENLVELKTHRDIQNDHQHRTFIKSKLLNTFTQCYLVGIQETCFGFRNNAGHIVNIKADYNLDEIERMSKGMWKKEAIMGFLHEVLSWCLSAIKPNTVYHLSYPGDENIELKVVESVNYLPPWLVEHVSKSQDEDD